MQKRFYLDYNATTPLLPEAAEAMRPFLDGQFGNPSSAHSWGRTARAAVDSARDQMAGLLGCHSREIIFCSGGTEANNLAILGVAHSPNQKNKGKHIMTCATEHHSVLRPIEKLEKKGFNVTILPVDGQGRLDPNLVEASFQPNTLLVSIMSANNETGTRQPIREIGVQCRAKGVLFHCDAIQSFGKEKVNIADWNVDLLTIASHKFYGPLGAALLYVRSGVVLEEVFSGGFQENERRAGTENVPAIAGMAKAAEKTSLFAEQENQRLFQLTEKLWEGLHSSISNLRRNGHSTYRLGNTLNVSFADCDSENLLIAMDLEGIGVSSGSACIVGSIQPSHVLQAMKVPSEWAKGTVRFSMGMQTREPDLPEIIERTAKVVKQLRRQGP